MGIEVVRWSVLISVFDLLFPSLGLLPMLSFVRESLVVLSSVVGSIIQYYMFLYSLVDNIELMNRIGLPFSSHLVALIVACTWVKKNWSTASPQSMWM